MHTAIIAGLKIGCRPNILSAGFKVLLSFEGTIFFKTCVICSLQDHRKVCEVLKNHRRKDEYLCDVTEIKIYRLSHKDLVSHEELGSHFKINVKFFDN